jgi:hypothetical protein
MAAQHCELRWTSQAQSFSKETKGALAMAETRLFFFGLKTLNCKQRMMRVMTSLVFVVCLEWADAMIIFLGVMSRYQYGAICFTNNQSSLLTKLEIL